MPSTAFMDYAETLQALSRGAVSLLDFSPAADGVTDDAVKINTAIAETAAAGKQLVIPSGRYFVAGGGTGATNGVLLSSGANVRCDNGATFVRGFTSTGARGFLSQSDFNERITNVRWRGGKFINPNDASGAGLTFFGDNVRIDDVEMEDVWVGLICGFAGDDNLLLNFRGRADAESIEFGPGGIRVWGGARNYVVNPDIWCVDDALQFQPTGGSFGQANMSISDSAFVGGRVSTHRGNMMFAGFFDATNDTMTGSVERVSFRGIQGNCGRAIQFTSHNLAFGPTRDVVVDGCIIDCSGNVDAITGPAARITALNTRVMSDIYISNTSILSPREIALQVSLAENVHWNGGRIDTPRTSSSITVRVDNCNGGSLKNVRVGAAASTGIRIGTSAAADVSNFEVDGCRVDNVANSQSGISVLGGTWVSLAKNTVKRASGATSATGITLGAASVSCTIRADNNLSGVDTATSVHGSATDAWVEARS